MKYKISDKVQGLTLEKAIIKNIKNGKYELLWEDGAISEIPIIIVDNCYKDLRDN